MNPVAFVVLLENLLPTSPDCNDEWVSGVVVENPFLEAKGRAKRHPEWVPDMVTDSAYFICALRSWHTLDHPKSVYELWDFESAWTSDALVVRAMADWPDEPDDAATPP